ncbi:hypothetical protein [Flagellimonas meridianipacifica]|uniref:Uncharacterized protein n=1 Tax=Flagellimonas meridianipacifica TaxID=1080225 RepID=A0A2T0MCD5_9FLAO|nr:hypothetical protein [Allomuricauda pacifica]PRX55149.1 hypothetical protein CLV81_3555 [Allomuricauda pacifica]
MKKSLLLTTVLLMIGLVGIQSVSAQFGNRFGRQRSTVPQAQPTPKEPEPITAEGVVNERMPSITEALELNPFEEAVVRTTLTKYVQKKLELQILKLEPKKMQEEYERLGKLQNEELKAGLPEDKYQAYLELEKNRFKAKKKKKKKKKNKE